MFRRFIVEKEKWLWAAAGLGAGIVIGGWWLKRKLEKAGLARVELLPPVADSGQGTEGLVAGYRYGADLPDYQVDPRTKAYGTQPATAQPVMPEQDSGPVAENDYFDRGEYGASGME